MDQEHKDPNNIDLEAPRLAWYKQKMWTRHQDTVYWVHIKLAQQKGFNFYQTRSNAIILYNTLPAYCIPKAIMMETGEIIYEKVYASPRPPPKISVKDNWMKELGSEVTEDSQQIQPKTKNPTVRTGRPFKSEQPSGSLTQEAGGCEDSQQIQPKTKNPLVRTVRHVKSEQPSGSLTQEIDKGVFFGCESTNVSTVRPVKSCASVC